jgi:hypothetical protein
VGGLMAAATYLLRETLTAMLGDASTAILWPEHAGKIPDGQRHFLLAYLRLEWAEHEPERSESEARSLLQAKGSGEKGGKRRFRNGVGFVLPVKSHSDQVRLLALQGDVGRRAMSNGALDTVAGKSTTGAWEARNARNTHSQATLRA